MIERPSPAHPLAAKLGRPAAPRRKLAAGDRLVGPAVASRAAGTCPVAPDYREPSDPQAVILAGGIDLAGPVEVLETVSFLHPGEELSQLVCAHYEELTRRKVTL
jgi:hypothetical protein